MTLAYSARAWRRSNHRSLPEPPGDRARGGQGRDCSTGEDGVPRAGRAGAARLARTDDGGGGSASSSGRVEAAGGCWSGGRGGWLAAAAQAAGAFRAARWSGPDGAAGDVSGVDPLG